MLTKQTLFTKALNWHQLHHDGRDVSLQTIMTEMVQSGKFFFSLRDFTERKMDYQYADDLWRMLVNPSKTTEEQIMRTFFSKTPKEGNNHPPSDDQQLNAQMAAYKDAAHQSIVEPEGSDLNYLEAADYENIFEEGTI